MSMTEEQRKVFEKFITKPSWMKEAVLTKRGWSNPKTGELLLGRRTPDWVFEEMERLQKPQVQQKNAEPEVVEVTQEQPIKPEIVEKQPEPEVVEVNDEPKEEIVVKVSETVEKKQPARRVKKKV